MVDDRIGIKGRPIVKAHIFAQADRPCPAVGRGGGRQTQHRYKFTLVAALEQFLHDQAGGVRAGADRSARPYGVESGGIEFMGHPQGSTIMRFGKRKIGTKKNYK